MNPVFPCNGATPDGKVCDNGTSGLLEIKCPYSVRDLTVAEAIQERNVFFLCQGENGIEMKKTHNDNLWFQVQGQLLVRGVLFVILLHLLVKT